MKGNLLSFPFICFSESGLFNGLRQKEQKESAPRWKPVLVTNWRTTSVMVFVDRSQRLLCGRDCHRPHSSPNFCFMQANCNKFGNSICIARAATARTEGRS